MCSELNVLSEEKEEDDLIDSSSLNQKIAAFNQSANAKMYEKNKAEVSKSSNLLKSKDNKDLKFRINTDLSHREFMSKQINKGALSSLDVRNGHLSEEPYLTQDSSLSNIGTDTELFRKSKYDGFATTRGGFGIRTQDQFKKIQEERMRTLENDRLTLEAKLIEKGNRKMNATYQGFFKQKVELNTNKWFTQNQLESNRVFRTIQEFVTVGDGGLHELIHDRLNPFIAGRAKNVTFVKDLFEV